MPLAIIWIAGLGATFFLAGNAAQKTENLADKIIIGGVVLGAGYVAYKKVMS